MSGNQVAAVYELSGELSLPWDWDHKLQLNGIHNLGAKPQ